MKPRVADTLKSMGCSASVEDFRRTLLDVKSEKFADWPIDELILTRDEAGDYCKEVKSRLGAPKLTRVFVLRSLLGTRKNRRPS